MFAASVLLLTWNQERFVEEAVRSLLSQDRDDIEIIVSDDASTDETWDILRRTAAAYAGPKQLRLRRNEANLGIVGNLCAAAGQASSRLLFIAHGDDVSTPNRCSRCIELHRSLGGWPQLIAGDAFDMAQDGSIKGVKYVDDPAGWTLGRWADRRPFVLGAAQMITRDLLDMAPLDSGLFCEDQCLSFRAIALGTAVRIAEPLIKHRRGGLSQVRSRGSWVKRRALLRSAHAALVEIEQLQRDAATIGCLARVQAALDEQRRLNTYIKELLDGKMPVLKRLRRCITTRLPWSKRLRFLVWSFRGRGAPPLAAPAQA